MSEYNMKKNDLEKWMRERLNPDYPILFNRINWDKVDNSIDELCEFQRQNDYIIPMILFYYKPVYNKIYPILQQENKIPEFIGKRHAKDALTYDSMYEFIQLFPQFKKFVFYDENPNDIYDEFLTIHKKNYPILFNRINWEYVDQNINRLYELLLSEKKPIIPLVLFMESSNGSNRGLKEMSENYENTTDKIYEYYHSEEEKGNKLFEEWFSVDDIDNLYSYDSMYEFIMAYPEFRDVVYFDESKI